MSYGSTVCKIYKSSYYIMYIGGIYQIPRKMMFRIYELGTSLCILWQPLWRWAPTFTIVCDCSCMFF